MSKVIDFNRVHRPTISFVMRDEAKTTIKVTTPTEGLVEELKATMPELKKVLGSKDKDSINLCYDLAARLINCNVSSVTVTADELRDKYGMIPEYLLIFYNAYLDFINDINSAKN